MIYTSYFAKLPHLPKNIVPISICGKAPEWYDGIQYKVLAPKYEFFQEWKKTRDNDYYIKHFNEEVLSKLNAKKVVEKLYALSSKRDIALICYEKPGDFCHRNLVAEWLRENGIKCDVREIQNMLPQRIDQTGSALAV